MLPESISLPATHIPPNTIRNSSIATPLTEVAKLLL